jgi:preprotein translocase subunit SecE
MKNKEMNFNYAECIKERNNIGETIYYNICNNETKKISWGSMEWGGTIMIFILIILLLLALLIAGFRCMFD